LDRRVNQARKVNKGYRVDKDCQDHRASVVRWDRLVLKVNRDYKALRDPRDQRGRLELTARLLDHPDQKVRRDHPDRKVL
jgi:hypothetical protein